MEAIFLSASVPYRKQRFRSDEEDRANQRYVAESSPDLIRDAVVELCRFAFTRDLGLIFGGHPAISPMVLHAARRFTKQQRKRVTVFQSEFFRALIPQATLQLSEWDYGDLRWTQIDPDPDRDERERKSLRLMRREMIDSPEIIAGIFIGGMDGVIDEGERFQLARPKLPAFAVGSTGSAARELQQRPGFAGSGKLDGDLQRSPSYPLLMRRIFEELGY